MDAIDRIKDQLSYDPATGEFSRRKSSNQYAVGAIAGSLDNFGYRRICVSGRFYKAHRLAWLFVHGYMPVAELDHINGKRDDNRIANLRMATRAMNTQNVALRKNSKSGFLGVSFYRPTGRWKAQITADGKKIYLGYHDTPEQAHAVYMAAKRELHPGFARAVIAADRTAR